jgi:hypothetical protein
MVLEGQASYAEIAEGSTVYYLAGLAGSSALRSLHLPCPLRACLLSTSGCEEDARSVTACLKNDVDLCWHDETEEDTISPFFVKYARTLRENRGPVE